MSNNRERKLDFWEEHESGAIKKIIEAMKSKRKNRMYVIASTPFGIHVWETKREV